MRVELDNNQIYRFPKTEDETNHSTNLRNLKTRRRKKPHSPGAESARLQLAQEFEHQRQLLQNNPERLQRLDRMISSLALRQKKGGE
jgi:uncharacterized membrane protein YccC